MSYNREIESYILENIEKTDSFPIELKLGIFGFQDSKDTAEEMLLNRMFDGVIKYYMSGVHLLIESA